jgi:hypothetical protein
LVNETVRHEGGAQSYGAISNPTSNQASIQAADQSHRRAEDLESISSEDSDHDKNILRTKV